jgi:hypothetical protein
VQDTGCYSGTIQYKMQHIDIAVNIYESKIELLFSPHLYYYIIVLRLGGGGNKYAIIRERGLK